MDQKVVHSILVLEPNEESVSQRHLAGGADSPSLSCSSSWRIVLAVASLTALTFLNSLSLGILTIGIPRIALELYLPENFLVWFVDYFPVILNHLDSFVAV